MDHERDGGDERYAGELKDLRRALYDVIVFLGDDRHLTAKGIGAREALVSELGELERNLEAARQEHERS